MSNNHLGSSLNDVDVVRCQVCDEPVGKVSDDSCGFCYDFYTGKEAAMALSVAKCLECGERFDEDDITPDGFCRDCEGDLRRTWAVIDRAHLDW